MRRASCTAALGLALASGWGLPAPAAPQYDPQHEFHGLPDDAGREEVYYTCVACHSMAIVMQQRLSERVWHNVLDRMIEEMGMPEPPAEDREAIVDYLVQHFGQDVPR